MGIFGMPDHVVSIPKSQFFQIAVVHCADWACGYVGPHTPTSVTPANGLHQMLNLSKMRFSEWYEYGPLLQHVCEPLVSRYDDFIRSQVAGDVLIGYTLPERPPRDVVAL